MTNPPNNTPDFDPAVPSRGARVLFADMVRSALLRLRKERPLDAVPRLDRFNLTFTRIDALTDMARVVVEVDVEGEKELTYRLFSASGVGWESRGDDLLNAVLAWLQQGAQEWVGCLTYGEVRAVREIVNTHLGRVCSVSKEGNEEVVVAQPSHELPVSGPALGAEGETTSRVSQAQALLDGRESKELRVAAECATRPDGTRYEVRTVSGLAVTGWGCVTQTKGDAELLAAAPALAQEVVTLGAENARLAEHNRYLNVRVLQAEQELLAQTKAEPTPAAAARDPLAEKHKAETAQLGRVMFSVAGDALVDLQHEVARLRKNLDALRSVHDAELSVSEGRRVQLLRVGEERAAEWKRAEAAESALAHTRERLAAQAAMVKVAQDDRADLIMRVSDQAWSLRAVTDENTRLKTEVAARDHTLLRIAAENELLHKELQRLRDELAPSHDLCVGGFRTPD
jgi:hypothetical protein